MFPIRVLFVGLPIALLTLSGCGYLSDEESARVHARDYCYELAARDAARLRPTIDDPLDGQFEGSLGVDLSSAARDEYDDCLRRFGRRN